MVPLVRVVVVNFNGGPLTLRCLRSLEATHWPSDRLELVLVDNGSQDGVAATAAKHHPRVRVLESQANLGFGGGCNLGLRNLGDVDYVALVNNDATVSPNWLRPLVTTLSTDASLGAACPKILFAPSFVDLALETSAAPPGWGDRRHLGVRVSGLRVGEQDRWRQTLLLSGFWGPEHGEGDEPSYQWTGPAASMRVPLVPGEPVPYFTWLRMAADVDKAVTLQSSLENVKVSVGRRPEWFRAPLQGSPYDVINNVGSQLVGGSYGSDRGFLEADRGQYDEPADVFAWCGGAVLLSRRYLDDVGQFDGRLFLYYEDLDLAWRGRNRGWRYQYVPDSVVRHVHSASSDKASSLFAFYNERNRLLTLARNSSGRRATTAAVRSLLITASYARRDVVSRLLRRRSPSFRIVGVRLRAFASFLRLLPGTLQLRAGDRLRGPRWWEHRPHPRSAGSEPDRRKAISSASISVRASRRDTWRERLMHTNSRKSRATVKSRVGP